MRIFNFTNLYPPQVLGGYELGCRDLVEGLSSRGHEIAVAATYFGLDRPRTEATVRRLFYNHRLPPYRLPSLLAWVRLERLEARQARELVVGFAPDVIVAWNLVGLAPHVILAALRSGRPCVHFISDQDNADDVLAGSAWFRYWAGRGWLRRMVAPALGRGRLETVRPADRFVDVVTVSECMAQRHRRWAEPRRCLVLPWAVPDPFHAAAPPSGAVQPPLRLLYVGQIHSQKGILTMIDALERLAATRPGSFRLTLVGDGHDPSFVGRVRGRLESGPLAGRATLTGRRSRAELPGVYRGHDVLIHPSELEEAFSITVAEAMASGLAVVASHTGGTPEAVTDGIDGWLFERGDAAGLAGRLERLVDHPELIRQLGVAAWRSADRYRLQTTVARLEAFLLEVVGGSEGAS